MSKISMDAQDRFHGYFRRFYGPASPPTADRVILIITHALTDPNDLIKMVG